METKKRNGAIDVVKFAGAIIVLAAHINEIGLGNIGEAANTLAVIVELFFIISGFFLMMHLDRLPKESKENTWTFIINKMKGFFAPLCVANLVHFFLYCRLNNLNTLPSVASKFWHFKWEFLCLQCLGMIQKPQFNQDYLLGTAWYLSAMMITLAVIYPLAKYYRKAFVNIVCPISIIFIYSAFIYNYGTINVGSENMLLIPDALMRAFAGQCCGVLCYYAYTFVKENDIAENGIYKAVDLISWLMLPLMVILAFSGIHDSAVFFIIPMALVVISAMLGTTPTASVLSKMPLKITGFLGKMSLYIYLTHFTVLLAVYNFLPSLSSALKCTLAVLTTLIYSLLLYILDKKCKSTKPLITICVLMFALSFVQILF